ncbi:MAG: hypothetical protein WCE84_03810 [Candidatus Rhabdochlamydia sp.]
MLHLSRLYPIHLLEERKIPFRKEGIRSHVLFQDLIYYKTEIEHAHRKTLDELSEEAQNLDMSY